MTTRTPVPLGEETRRFTDAAPEIATIATVDPDGQPQLSPVWIKRDGDDLLFSTTRSRRKPANIARDPKVTVLIIPRDDPYAYLEVRGTAVLEDDPDGSLINELSRRYDGKDWEDAPGVERLIVRVTPHKVVVYP
jgi:PPOX class probable F420-dependent enzyme